MSNWKRHMIEFSSKRIVSNTDGKNIKVYLTSSAVRAFSDFNNVRAYLTQDGSKISNLGRFSLHKKIEDGMIQGKHYILCEIQKIED